MGLGPAGPLPPAQGEADEGADGRDTEADSGDQVTRVADGEQRLLGGVTSVVAPGVQDQADDDEDDSEENARVPERRPSHDSLPHAGRGALGRTPYAVGSLYQGDRASE